MRWARKTRTRMVLSGSLWILAVPGFVLGILAAMGLMRLDWRYQWVALGLGSAGAQAFLASIVGTLISFVGIAFSVMVLMVQLASAQLTPRVVKPLSSGPFAKAVLTVALFTLGYSFNLLLRSGDRRVPQLAVAVSVLLAVLTILGFVTLLDRVGRGVRFGAIITSLGRMGVRAVEHRYPRLAGASAGPGATPAPPAPRPGAAVVAHTGPAGLVQAYDIAGLAGLARRRDVSIVALRAPGEYIYPGAALFRVEGAAAAEEYPELKDAVVVGLERTLEWDPGFSLRLLVDIGIRALSPAINDPATGVHTVGAIQQILAALGPRALDDPPDPEGRVHVPGPSWEGFVDLACTELRMFGGGAVAVLRRLRAMLEELEQTLPQARRPALRQQLDLLDRSAEQTCPQPEEQALARQADPLGLG